MPGLIVSHKLVLARRVVMLGRKPDKERIVKAWIVLMLALSLPVAAVAEEAKEGEAPKVNYISLSPPFVGNYGWTARRSSRSTRPTWPCA
jgi:flagellar FliL protein